jgi:hypothetical protein
VLQRKIAMPVRVQPPAVLGFYCAPPLQPRFEPPLGRRLKSPAGLEYRRRVIIIGRKA